MLVKSHYDAHQGPPQAPRFRTPARTRSALELRRSLHVGSDGLLMTSFDLVGSSSESIALQHASPGWTAHPVFLRATNGIEPQKRGNRVQTVHTILDSKADGHAAQSGGDTACLDARMPQRLSLRAYGHLGTVPETVGKRETLAFAGAATIVGTLASRMPADAARLKWAAPFPPNRRVTSPGSRETASPRLRSPLGSGRATAAIPAESPKQDGVGSARNPEIRQFRDRFPILPRVLDRLREQKKGGGRGLAR